MSLIDIFRGNRPKKDKKTQDFLVDTASDGNEIYADDLVSGIKEELEKRRDERWGYELQWTLNANFLSGHQNCDIDTFNRKIFTEEQVTKADHERRVYNRIAPLMETRHANLKSIEYDMLVKPRTNEPEDVEKAKISTLLLKYCQSITNFDSKKDQLISWCEICGTAFTMSWWDKNAGDVIGKEILYKEDLLVPDNDTPEESGSPVGVGKTIEEKDIHIGEIAFGLISAYEVFPHCLTVERIEDQHDIIIEQVWDVDKIKEVYGVDVEGSEIESYTMMPLEKSVMGHGRNNVAFGIQKEKRKDSERVIYYMENPTERYKNGRFVIIVKDIIVFYGELPSGVMPLVAFKAKPAAGLFFGRSVIQDLIPLQRSYNAVENKIVDFIYSVCNNPIICPAGSVNVDALSQGISPGMIIEYSPDTGGKPEVMSYPSPPPIIFDEKKQLSQDMEYTAGVSQLMVYGAAASSASGKALDTRRQIDLTRMSLTGDNIRDGVIEMAKLWLRINKRFSTGYRTMLITGRDNISAIYTWTSDDINSFDVEFTMENELRRGQEQQKQDFMALFSMGLFTDENGVVPQEIKRRALELFGNDDFQKIDCISDLQKKNARRENSYLENGVIPERYKYDDDKIHLEEHIKYALSNDFRLIRRKSPQLAEAFDLHIQEHQNAIQQMQQNMQQQAMMQAFQMSQNNKPKNGG